jgi:voltage-dependent potassium channel beta subunit
MDSSSKKSKMIYRYLGNSGLRVSILSWGNWLNVKNTDDITTETVKVALEHGVNFFDTAEIYGFGEAEKSLGEAFETLKPKREEIVVSTKIFKVGLGVNDSFLSRKHIIEGTKNSLNRLKLDYVDVIFCHRPDSNTPLEETCRAMNWVIEKGWAFYWGTSEWSASLIMEAYMICEKYGLIKPIVEQCQYNMMVREKMENEYNDLFKRYKMGTTIWSPLFSGVLTGKYINEIPSGSRFDVFSEGSKNHSVQYIDNKKAWDEKLLKIKEIAESLGCSLTQLAILWTIKNPEVSTCILGASKPQQLEENLNSLEFFDKYTPEIESQVEAILSNTPPAEMDWLSFTRLPPKRQTVLGTNSKYNII